MQGGSIRAFVGFGLMVADRCAAELPDVLCSGRREFGRREFGRREDGRREFGRREDGRRVVLYRHAIFVQHGCSVGESRSSADAGREGDNSGSVGTHDYALVAERSGVSASSD